MSSGKDSPTRLARLGRLTNDPKNADARVFVGNISAATVSEPELRDIFSQYGEILGLSMHNNGKYAFVQYETEEQAQLAITGAIGHLIRGKRIDVRPAVDKKSSRPSGYSGHDSRPRHPSHDSRAPPTGRYRQTPADRARQEAADAASRALVRSDFRVFDVGQTAGSSRRPPPQPPSDRSAGDAAWTPPGSSESSRPPDYSGAPGARYAPPSHNSSSAPTTVQDTSTASPRGRNGEPASSQGSHPGPPAHHHVASRSPVPSLPPADDRHHGRSRSPHWPSAERPVSPGRYVRRGRSRSPGWYRFEEERRRYEYELARWEDEERYRRWYYEHYSEPRHGDRYDPYYRDHYRGHERGRERERHGGRYEDYWRGQEGGRHPDHHHPDHHHPDHHHPDHHAMERDRRGYEAYSRDRERYAADAAPAPPIPPAPRRSPPRDQHNELFDKERAPSSAHPPASQLQRPPLDSLVLMVHKQQQGYANMISHRLKEAGMLSETREMPTAASLRDVMAAGIKRKLLFLFLVTSDNELHRSLSVHILHTSPVQEHKNMPFDDALELVKANFEEYCADVRAGRVPSRLGPASAVSASARVAHSPPRAPASTTDEAQPAAAPRPSSSAAADISSEQLSSLISSLREKQQQQLESEPLPTDGAKGDQPLKTEVVAGGEPPKFNWTV